MIFKHFVLGVVVLALMSTLAVTAQQNSGPQAKPSKDQGQGQTNHPQDDSARVFQQNCSRCHNAPEGFAPRISGTIVRHMRVRASLSQHDEEQLLRFFNP